MGPHPTHGCTAALTVLCLALSVQAAETAKDAPSPTGLINLAGNAAVKARTSLESPPLWSKDYLADGVRAAGGYCARSAVTRVHVTTALRGFTGAWSDIAWAGAYGGEIAYAAKVGDAFEYTFEGDSIAWIGGKNKEHGDAEVFIDGKLEATVNTKSPTLVGQQVLFRKNQLGAGKHTIKIRVASAGATDINALDITDSSLGPVKAEAAPGEVDEWVELDLGAEKAFSHVRLCPVRMHAADGSGAPSFPVDYSISVKAEAGAYATVKTIRGQVNPGAAPVTLPVGQQRARYVKLTVSKVGAPLAEEKSYALRLAEVEVLGPAPREPQSREQTSPPPQPHWRLGTDDTTVTVAVVDDRPVLWELGHPRQGWNWLPARVPIPLPSQIEMQGEKKRRSATWKFVEGNVDGANGKTLTLRFACNEAPNLQFACKWWAADGRGPVEYREAVENETGKRVTLLRLSGHLDLNVRAEREVVLWRFHKDAGVQSLAKNLFLDVLSDGSLHAAPLRGGNTTGYGYIPFVALDGGHHGLYVAGEWQEGDIRVAASGARPVTVRVGLPSKADHLEVPAGQAVTPALYLGAYTGSVDDGCNAFKRWFFRHKSPENMRKDPTEPWTQFAAMWSRGGGWHQRQEVFAQGMKERLSDIGIESACIDHGWWVEKDLWVGEPKKWPGGMEMAGKLAHENGFKLTLYFMNCGNNLEWGKKLSECMTRYGVDTWRSDFGAPSGPAGLAMLDWLKANHPKFRFEFCDCGAPQKDFVMAQRATVFFGIDVYDPLSNRKMFHTSSYCLPPAQIQSPSEILPGFQRGVGPGVYGLRSAMQGALDTGMNGGANPKMIMPSDLPAMIEPVKQNVALYKTRLRPLIREADLYHITLPPDGVDWDGLQYQHPVSGQGAVLLFKPKSQADTRRFFLRGLDRGTTYSLTFQDRPEQNLRRNGAALMDDGFDVTMPGQEVSEIVWIEPAK